MRRQAAEAEQRKNLLKKKTRRSKKKKSVKKTRRWVYFNQTPLGDFLKRNCPTEFQLIDEARKQKQNITADFIDKLASASDNPAFQSPEFRLVLGDYRKYRCHTPNVGKFNLNWETDVIRKRLEI